MSKIQSVTLAMTGASGMPYGFRLLESLLQAEVEINLLFTKAARLVIATETDVQLPAKAQDIQGYLGDYFKVGTERLNVYALQDWMAPIASGSGVADAMVVCPCTSGTLAAFATGHSDNLVERAADVTLKERKKLIVVHRETPLSEIHLQHMLTLTRMGALMLTANPGFYHTPKSIQDLVDFVVARILDHLDVPQRLMPAWGKK